jgi:hypothetical protein
MADEDVRHNWRGNAAALIALVACLTIPSLAAAQDPNGALPPPATSGLLAEPRFLTEGINLAIDFIGEGNDLADGRRDKGGLYPELSNMTTGAGFLSAGPGYRLFPLGGRVLLDASAAVSWHLYKMAQGRFEVRDLARGHLTVGSQVMWQDQTQIHYFGIGDNSTQDNESQYRMRHADIVGYATVQTNDWFAIAGEFGWLSRPTILPPGGTFKPNLPDTSEQFPGDPGISASAQPTFLHGEASVNADTRDYRNHPTSGGLYRAAVTAYSDRSDGTFSFRQYEAEAGHFIPLADRNWILAFRGWLVASDVPGDHDIPFYLLPSLGGHNTLRGYASYRFHDRHLVAVNAESRVALLAHLDAALFVDAGNVAPRVRDLNLRKVNYGAGLRLHSGRATFARFDVAHGDEGWNFVLRTSEPFGLKSLARVIARVPFAP